MRQAFHDRYLLLYAHDETTRVFPGLPSVEQSQQSRRRLAFCPSLLAADVGREVRSYIEGLCDGRDVAKDKSLTVTLRWSSNALLSTAKGVIFSPPCGHAASRSSLRMRPKRHLDGGREARRSEPLSPPLLREIRRGAGRLAGRIRAMHVSRQIPKRFRRDRRMH
jgi:hypothetical protein